MYLLSGANGIGKTAALAVTAASIVFPTDNKFFQGELFQNFPYQKKTMRILSDIDTIKDTIIPEIQFWFPEGKYQMSKEAKAYISKITTSTGWTIEIRTYDQEPRKHESSTVSVILADEPMPYKLYSANVSRLRLGGIMIIFATLLEGAAWIVPEIIEDKSGDTFYMYVSAEDACKQHGVRGHLEHEQILKMAGRYEAEERIARIFGKPMALAGVVFKGFNPDIHVIEPFDLNAQDFSVWHSLDTHQIGETPEAGIWIAVDRQGNYYVVDELFGKWGDSELAARIKRKNSYYRIDKMLIEPGAYVLDQIKSREDGKEISLAKTLEEKHGLMYIPGSKKRHLAVRKTKEALHYQQVNGEFVQRPKLYIFNTCTELIWEMKTWMYQPESKKVQEYREKYRKFVDKDDHLIEAMGRIIVEDPQFTESRKVRNEAIRDYNYSVY